MNVSQALPVLLGRSALRSSARSRRSRARKKSLMSLSAGRRNMMVGRTRSFGVWNGASPTLVCGFLGEAGVLNQHPADSEEDAPTGFGVSTSVGCST